MNVVLKFRICLLLLLGVAVSAHAQRNLSNPNASKEAKAVYRYIQDMYGKKILSGQMWSNYSGDELAYVQTHTGKQPALRGMDFMTSSQNNAEVQRAIDWWRTGGIPTIMWHWGAPSKGEGYTASQQTIDINRCFQPGTAEYTAFWNELRIKADLLQRLRDANVPVLWRPYHELNGNWFWWGKGGSAQFKRLWTTMYNYFVNDRGLNNLIWVLCYTGSPDGSWFPGNQYVDIAGADTYANSTSPQLEMFNRTKNATGGNAMPIAFHECGVIPNPDQCLSQGAMWSWWMVWHSSHLFNMDRAYLRTAYNHTLVITKDEVPNIMATYGTDVPPPVGCGTAPNGFPICCNGSASDPDGDGWGWENNQSCFVSGGSSTALANGVYSIVARHSGKVLDVAGAATTDGANVQQWTNSGGNNQRWIVRNEGSNTYSIRAVHSTKALDVNGVSTADGANVHQWAYSGGNNQKWRIEGLGGGYYRVVSVNSSKCLEVANNATTDGANVQQWSCSGGMNQQFQFTYLAAARLAQPELEAASLVYPNPSAKAFTCKQAGSFTYLIHDASGKKLESGQGVDQATVGENLLPGLYMLRVQSAQGVKVEKLIKK